MCRNKGGQPPSNNFRGRSQHILCTPAPPPPPSSNPTTSRIFLQYLCEAVKSRSQDEGTNDNIYTFFIDKLHCEEGRLLGTFLASLKFSPPPLNISNLPHLCNITYFNITIESKGLQQAKPCSYYSACKCGILGLHEKIYYVVIPECTQPNQQILTLIASFPQRSAYCHAKKWLLFSIGFYKIVNMVTLYTGKFLR